MKIIGKTSPDRASMIACLLRLGLWDSMTFDEREAAVNRGEIWDTDAGRTFMETVKRLQPGQS